MAQVDDPPSTESTTSISRKWTIFTSQIDSQQKISGTNMAGPGRAAAMMKRKLMSKFTISSTGSNSASTISSSSFVGPSPQTSNSDLLLSGRPGTVGVRRFLQDNSEHHASFVTFLKHEYAEELVLLWEGIEDLVAGKSQPADSIDIEYLSRCEKVYQTYLGPDSPHSIGLGLELSQDVDGLLLFGSNGLNGLGQERHKIGPESVQTLLVRVQKEVEEKLQPYVQQYTAGRAPASAHLDVHTPSLRVKPRSSGFLLGAMGSGSGGIVGNEDGFGSRARGIEVTPSRREMKRIMQRLQQEYIHFGEKTSGERNRADAGATPPTRRHTQGNPADLELGRPSVADSTIKRSRSSPAFVARIARRLSGRNMSSTQRSGLGESDGAVEGEVVAMKGD
eukprot:comp21036_c0_seq1/m.28264 comp21036_c0_seq1/g.28264  ORF comp21036_c0_seq1/g.28264 comp21036_c0_seq1/m.28264 type:complete len:392 (-) comp21036_c0_seq1:68-1243(-)